MVKQTVLVKASLLVLHHFSVKRVMVILEVSEDFSQGNAQGKREKWLLYGVLRNLLRRRLVEARDGGWAVILTLQQ